MPEIMTDRSVIAASRRLLFCVLALSWAETMSWAEAPSGPGVKVEILESIPDQTSWNFTPPEPTETYAEPAFGFPYLPARYSAKGIKVDRGAPFVVRASAEVTLPKGEHRILMRARNGARLFMDGKLILSNKFASLNSDGHEEVPEISKPAAPDIRYLRPGHFETVATLRADGQAHLFVLETVIGSKNRRPEPGELCVAAAAEEGTFQLLSPDPNRRVLLTEDGWDDYATGRIAAWKNEEAKRRLAVSSEER